MHLEKLQRLFDQCPPGMLKLPMAMVDDMSVECIHTINEQEGSWRGHVHNYSNEIDHFLWQTMDGLKVQQLTNQDIIKWTPFNPLPHAISQNHLANPARWFQVHISRMICSLMSRTPAVTAMGRIGVMVLRPLSPVASSLWCSRLSKGRESCLLSNVNMGTHCKQDEVHTGYLDF